MLVTNGKRVVYMKLNNNGSLTTEVSVLFGIIFITVLLLLQNYLFQVGFYSLRGMQRIGEESPEKTHDGLYFDGYESVLEVTFLEEEPVSTRAFDESLDYLKLLHHYLMLDDLGEVIDEAVQEY